MAHRQGGRGPVGHAILVEHVGDVLGHVDEVRSRDANLCDVNAE
jgi:hypothetical protein